MAFPYSQNPFSQKMDFRHMMLTLVLIAQADMRRKSCFIPTPAFYDLLSTMASSTHLNFDAPRGPLAINE